MTNLSNITTISFDVDGTLWDFERFTRHALQQVLNELAQIDPQAAHNLTVGRMVTIRDRVHQQMWGGGTDLDAIREKSMQQALREAGRPNDSLGSYLTKFYFQRREEVQHHIPRRPTRAGVPGPTLQTRTPVQRQQPSQSPRHRRPGNFRGIFARP